MYRPNHSYLIACYPRTGSWLLTYALQDSGVAASPDEYFAPEITAYWTMRFALNLPDAGGSYEDYLSAVFRFGTSPDGLFGSKLLWQSVEEFTNRLRQIREYADLETPDLLPAVFPHLRIVMLQRRDKVRAAVSHWRAAITGIWAVEPNGRPAWRSPIELLPTDFQPQVISNLHDQAHAEENSWVRLAEDMHVPCLQIEYEGLVADWDKTLRQILQFLGKEFPPFSPTPKHRLMRQADEATEEYVSAWRAVTGGCAACERG